jgi:hypothetical protein
VPPSALILVLASATHTSTISALVYSGDLGWAETLVAQVEDELERSIPVTATSSSAALSDLVAMAQRSTGSDVWIVLPERRGEVAVVRPRDRTVLTRSLDPDISEYALAIATSELVRLLEARSGPIVEVGVGVGVRFSGAAEIESSPENEGTLILPSIGIGLELRRWITPLEPDIILTVRFPGGRAGGGDALSYRRFGLGAGVGSSLVLGWILLRASVLLDVSFTQVSSKTGEASVGGRNRTVYGLEAQLGLRLPLGAGFDLELTGGAAVAINPAEFRIGEEIALSEGRGRIRAVLAFGWSTP